MKNKKSQVTNILESSVRPLLELKFSDPLFALVAHPSKPVLAVGLANGYVYVLEYDHVKLSLYAHGVEEENKSKDAKDQVKKVWTVETVKKDMESSDALKVLWRTKRHKGSVRSLCFNAEGDHLYSIGSDKVLKKADTMSGKVIKKNSLEKCEATKMIKSETHAFLVIGQENGKVSIVNSDTLELERAIDDVHEDAVNDIIPMKHQSVYSFVTVGSTTLSIIDAKKGKVKQTSDNQEDEMLSCCFVNPEKGDTLICGMGEGIVTVWKQKKNALTDQISRIKVNKDESIDCVISTLNEEEGECAWCGCSNGDLFKIDVKRGKLIESRVHSFSDEVGFLDLDYEYRLISAGMDKLKLWGESTEEDEEEEMEFSDSDSDDMKSEDTEEEKEEDEDEEEEFAGFSDEEKSSVEKEEKEEDAEQPKKKKAKLTTKQVRNLQKHEHGIRKFDDL